MCSQAKLELGDLQRKMLVKPRLKEALANIRSAVKFAPERAEYHYLLGEMNADLAGVGNATRESYYYRQAVDAYWSALTVDPDHSDAFFTLLWFQLYRADWRYGHEMGARVAEFVLKDLAPPPPGATNRNPSIRPLQAFLLLDADLQREVMRSFAHDVVETTGRTFISSPIPTTPAAAALSIAAARRGWASEAGSALEPAHQRRLKVGYVSSDLGNHPLGHDFGHFFEYHDVEQFEVYAFNTRSRPDPTHWRSKIVDHLRDHWIDLSSLSDEEAARVISSLQLDVLINLNGYTPGSRNAIFAYRPAPVQVMWKGWAGSIGAEYVPFLISDKISSPPEQADQYTETLLYTPYSYFLNDYRQTHDRLLEIVSPVVCLLSDLQV